MKWQISRQILLTRWVHKGRELGVNYPLDIKHRVCFYKPAANVYGTLSLRVSRCRGFDYKRGVVTHCENIIERKFQTDARKLSSQKASSRPHYSC